MTGQEQDRKVPEAPAYRPLEAVPGFKSGRGWYEVGGRRVDARRLPAWDAEEWRNRQRYLYARALENAGGDAAEAGRWMLANSIEWDMGKAREWHARQRQLGLLKAREFGWNGLGSPGSAYERQADYYRKWLPGLRRDPLKYYGTDDISLAASRFGGAEAFHWGFLDSGRMDLLQDTADAQRNAYGATASSEGVTAGPVNWLVSKATGGTKGSVAQLLGADSTGVARSKYLEDSRELLEARQRNEYGRLMADPEALRARADAYRSQLGGDALAALPDAELVGRMMGLETEEALGRKADSADRMAAAMSGLGSAFGAFALGGPAASRLAGWLKGGMTFPARFAGNLARSGSGAGSLVSRFAGGGRNALVRMLSSEGRWTGMAPLVQAGQGAGMMHAGSALAQTADTGDDRLDAALRTAGALTEVGAEAMETAPLMALGQPGLPAGMSGRFAAWLGRGSRMLKRPVGALAGTAGGLARGAWQGLMDNAGDALAGRTADTNVWNYVMGPWGTVAGAVADSTLPLLSETYRGYQPLLSPQAHVREAALTGDYLMDQKGAGARAILGSRHADALQGREIPGSYSGTAPDGSPARADFHDISDEDALRRAAAVSIFSGALDEADARGREAQARLGTPGLHAAYLSQVLSEGGPTRSLPRTLADGLKDGTLDDGEAASLLRRYVSGQEIAGNGLRGLRDGGLRILGRNLGAEGLKGSLGALAGRKADAALRSGKASPEGFGEILEKTVGRPVARQLLGSREFLENVSEQVSDSSVNGLRDALIFSGRGLSGSQRKAWESLPEPAREAISGRVRESLLQLDADWVRGLDDGQLMKVAELGLRGGSEETLRLLGLDGDGEVRKSLAGLEAPVRERVWSHVWENPLENIPKVASLWLGAKDMEGLGGFLRSPLAFWGTALMLLLGAGSLLSGGGGEAPSRESSGKQAERPSDGHTLLGGLESAIDTGGMI